MSERGNSLATERELTFNDPLSALGAIGNATTADHDVYPKIFRFGFAEERAVVLAGTASMAALPYHFDTKN